jgi:alkylated DNA nucleotide flippase Atl1
MEGETAGRWRVIDQSGRMEGAEVNAQKGLQRDEGVSRRVYDKDKMQEEERNNTQYFV